MKVILVANIFTVMLYRLVYWLFVSHFIRLAFIARRHWINMEYDEWLSKAKLYSKTSYYSYDRKECSNNAKPKGILI